MTKHFYYAFLLNYSNGVFSITDGGKEEGNPSLGGGKPLNPLIEAGLEATP